MAGSWRVVVCVVGALVGLAGVAGLYVAHERRRFRRRWRWCTSQASMKGKIVIVTGASAGIGKATASDLARRGARVIMACRNLQKAHKVAEEIKKDTGSSLVEVQLLDTSSMASVRNFANNFVKNEKRLDVLILNAGILGPSRIALTEDNHEITMATNHFGHFLLTNILLDLLKKSSPSRIVVVSSKSYEHALDFEINDLNNKNRPYAGIYQSYCSTKLCNVLFAKQLSIYLEGTGVVCNSLCPGLVRTEIFYKCDDPYWRKFIESRAAKTEEEGAQTTIHLAVAEEEAKTTGKFFDNCQICETSPLSNDIGLAKKLWEKSEDFVDLKPEEKHY